MFTGVLALLIGVRNGRLCGKGEPSQRIPILKVQVVFLITFLFFVQARHDDDEDRLNFKGGNVHLITTKEGWEQKIAEANRDGKTVSKS